MADLAEAAACRMGAPAERSHWQVATMGYAASVGLLAPERTDVLADGIRWLAQRSWNRPFRPPTLEVDGVSMLGVALGTKAAGMLREAGPLGALAVGAVASESLSAFNRSLMAAAAHAMEAPGRPDLSTMLPEARVAFADIGLLDGEVDCQRDAWRNALRCGPNAGAAHASLTLRAFDALCERNMPARFGRLEVEDVVRMLSGIPRSLRHWTWEDRARTKNSAVVRWDVENEYHVQNLLWAVLAPSFPDLNAEEYAPPVGQKNPRMDLTIPSLRLVIEVKFVRPGARFADIVEEIAADAALYGTDRRWTSLVPFVWDESRRVEEHAKLVEGLKSLSMVEGVVIVSRPGKMERKVAGDGV